ncbi:MAG: type II toxin-antitoxin system RelE/ParE family toxin [Verrucomicrobiales bacterium]|nr:type II toxin-antitoxin system RelE/ParE family toxin [Verrucomicrobiales bacterium]
MSWDYKFKESALKDLHHLDRQVQQQIFKYLDKHVKQASNPADYGKLMVGGYFGYIRYRVGAYRLICEIRNHELVVLIVEVGHRREIYKR